MKRFLSLLLVVAMIVSLGICCIPASAEKADKSLSAIDLAQLAAEYGKYLNADTIKAVVSAFTEVKENGISIDSDTVAFLVSAISNYIGDGNTIDLTVVKAFITGAADAIANGVDLDAGTFAKVLAAASSLFSQGGGISASAITTLLVALDKALPTDTADINAILAALTGNGFDPPALEASTLTIILNCIKDKAIEGIKLEMPTVTNLVKAFNDFQAAGGKLNADVIEDVVKATTGNEEYAACMTIICEVTGMYPYSDIADSGFRKEICEANFLGIIQGYQDGTFRPNQIVSRAQFITMLWRAAGEPSAKGTLTFKDTASIAAPYQEAVIWGVTRGIIKGYNDGTFLPNQNISRAQMATFLYRYLKNVQFYDFGFVMPTIVFSDSKQIAAPYVDAVKAICSLGIMKGNSNGTFAPNDGATRGMAATVILRTYKVTEIA